MKFLIKLQYLIKLWYFRAQSYFLCLYGLYSVSLWYYEKLNCVITAPKLICQRPTSQYLWMWLYLEIRTSEETIRLKWGCDCWLVSKRECGMHTETQGMLMPRGKAMWAQRGGSQREASGDTKPTDTLVLGLPATGTVRKLLSVV